MTPAVFAIIDANGQIVDRVELPARRTIAGFDRAGNVYAVTSTPGGFQVERYRYSRP